MRVRAATSARAQIHFYLSEIFPDTLGKPIFGN
jgi:hypothetical protein